MVAERGSGPLDFPDPDLQPLIDTMALQHGAKGDDHRGLGDLRLPPPKSFSGTLEGSKSEAEFELYSKHLKAFMNLKDPRLKTLMKDAESAPGPIGLPHDEKDKALAAYFQSVLTLTTSDKAARVIHREDDDNGFESWRRLYVRYAPSKRVRYLGSIQKILSWKFSEANLEQEISDWCQEIERYEADTKATIPDDIKIGILMSSTPSTIQQHLQLNTSLTTKFSEVYDIILNFCKTRRLTKHPKHVDDPMDIGAIWKHLKGKGKGKSNYNIVYRPYSNFGNWSNYSNYSNYRPRKGKGKGGGGEKGKGRGRAKEIWSQSR